MVRPSLFSNLFKKFSFTGFLNGASKTLNVVNQAIPIYYQVKPMISNAKTMFKVMNAVKNNDSKITTKNVNISKPVNKVINNHSEKITYTNDGSPTFFM